MNEHLLQDLGRPQAVFVTASVEVPDHRPQGLNELDQGLGAFLALSSPLLALILALSHVGRALKALGKAKTQVR